MTDRALDRLVDDWLARVEQAAADLPDHRRAELLADLREHITVARADLTTETEAGVRTILERLGDPATIAAEARRHEPDPPPAPPAWPAAGSATAPAGQSSRRRRTGAWVAVVVAVVAVVCLGCAVAGLAAWSLFGVHEVSGTAPEPVQAPIEVPSPRPAPVTPGPDR